MDGTVATQPDALARADWRRRMTEVYAGVRARPDHGAQTWEGWRAVRDHMFETHPGSPLSVAARRSFEPLAYYGYDPAFRFVVGTTNSLDTEPASFACEAGEVTLQPVLETVGLLELLGRELTIYWVRGHGGGLYLPFADAASPSGRLLLDGAQGVDLGAAEDGRLVLDFNFAYNPSGAYAPGRTCPPVPERNRLDVAIEAGERHG